METGTTITSLTNLKPHRHLPTPFGGIDASTDNGVALDVSMASDSSGSESAKQFQSGKASGRSMLSGSIPSQSVTPNLLQGRNLGGMTGSVALDKASSLQSPTVQTLQSASPQSTALSSSFRSPQSASSQLPQSVGTVPQSGSASNAPTALKINGFPAPSEVKSGRDVSGSPRSSSSLASSRSHQATAHLGGLVHSSDSQGFASDRSPDDAFSLKMDADPDESTTRSADKQEATGFLEAVKDPFTDQLKGPFTGNRKHFGMERVCGDSCLPETSFDESESATPAVSKSAHSIGPSDRSALHLYSESATLQAPTHGRHRFRRGTSISNSIADMPEGRRKP